MTESRILRKGLWNQLGKIKKREDWFRAAEKLGLVITQPKGGSSHYAIRFPGYDNFDIKGLISCVYDPVRRDISEKIFKKLLEKGYCEDDIWIALGMIKRKEIESNEGVSSPASANK